MVDPSESSLDEEAKILAVLKILRGLRMMFTDLILHLISQRPSMATWREGFVRSKVLVQFLNVLSTDERASEQLRVSLRPFAIALAIAMVVDEVDAEMEAAKHIFHMSSKDVAPELLLSFNLDTLLTEPLQETTPLLRRILLSAMQTVRAVKENKHQNVDRTLFKLSFGNKIELREGLENLLVLCQ
ncbi:hypothetical protein F4604DRAFT_1680524 [Suillus subluteus]|nr:hypothetical protein F4604DRAFT_1680524 [Suillus subluteus]